MPPSSLLSATPVRAAIVPQKTIIVDQNLATLAQLTEPDITGLICQAFLYGIYVSIAWPTVSTLIYKRPRSKPWFFLLTVTILMFLMSTVCLVLEAVNTMGVFEGIKLETEGAFQPPTAWYGFRGANDRTLVQAIIFSLEFILGDAVVIWRAGALWGFNMKVMVPMLVVLLADFATTLYFIGCEGTADWWYIASTEPKSCNVSQRGMFLLSFSTNVVATSFIAIKAWYHRQAFIAMPDSLSSSSTWKLRRSPAQRIMLLFLESGFVYMLFWAACSFTYFPFVTGVGSPSYFMTVLFNSIRYQMVGLYPTAIVLLVHRQRSSWDTPEVSTSLRTSFKAAPGPVGSQASKPLPSRLRVGQKQLSSFDNLSTIGTVDDLVEHRSESRGPAQNSSDAFFADPDMKAPSVVSKEAFIQAAENPYHHHERSPSDGPSVKSEETIVANS